MQNDFFTYFAKMNDGVNVERNKLIIRLKHNFCRSYIRTCKSKKNHFYKYALSNEDITASFVCLFILHPLNRISVQQAGSFLAIFPGKNQNQNFFFRAKLPMHRAHAREVTGLEVSNSYHSTTQAVHWFICRSRGPLFESYVLFFFFLNIF